MVPLAPTRTLLGESFSLYVLFRRRTAPVLIRAAPRVTQFRYGAKEPSWRCGIIASAPLLR